MIQLSRDLSEPQRVRYALDLAFRKSQLDATRSVARSLEGQGYDVWRQAQATERVVTAMAAQYSVLDELRTELNQNTQVARENTARLLEIAAAQAESNDLLSSLAVLQFEGNQTLRSIDRATHDTNTILLRSATLWAKRFLHLEPWEVFPDWFDPPLIAEPRSIPQQFQAVQARVDLADLTLQLYMEQFGEKVVHDVFQSYFTTSRPSKDVVPGGVRDNAIAAAYGRIAAAEKERSNILLEYENQLALLKQTIRSTVERSHIKATLESLNHDYWDDAGSLEPIIIDTNYARLGELDTTQVAAGYRLVSPLRYKPEEGSFVSVVVHSPLKLIYSPKTGQITSKPSTDILVIEGDGSIDTVAFEPIIIQDGWIEQALGRERVLTSNFLLLERDYYRSQLLQQSEDGSSRSAGARISYRGALKQALLRSKAAREQQRRFRAIVKGEPGPLADALGESQTRRMLGKCSFSSLKTASDARLREDVEALEAKIVHTLRQVDELHDQIEEYTARVSEQQSNVSELEHRLIPRTENDRGWLSRFLNTLFDDIQQEILDRQRREDQLRELITEERQQLSAATEQITKLLNQIERLRAKISKDSAKLLSLAREWDMPPEVRDRLTRLSVASLGAEADHHAQNEHLRLGT